MSAFDIVTQYLEAQGWNAAQIEETIEDVYCRDLGDTLEEWAAEIERDAEETKLGK